MPEEGQNNQPILPNQGENQGEKKFVAGDADIEVDIAEEDIEVNAFEEDIEVDVAEENIEADVAEENIEADVAEEDTILGEKLLPKLERVSDRSSSPNLETIAAGQAIAVGNFYQVTAQSLISAALDVIQTQQQLNTSARAATSKELLSIYKIGPRAAATKTSHAIARDRPLEIQQIAKVLGEIFGTN